MNLSIIAAVAKNHVIGAGNNLPWHLSGDLKHFKKLTMGHTVVMGRKTFESIGKPLPGRKNIVITRNPSFRAEGVTVAGGLDEALALCKNDGEVFVIGGAEIYRAALPKADRLYLTRIDRDFEGDAYFPEIDLKKEFEITAESEPLSENGVPYRFLTAARKNN